MKVFNIIIYLILGAERPLLWSGGEAGVQVCCVMHTCYSGEDWRPSRQAPEGAFLSAEERHFREQLPEDQHGALLASQRSKLVWIDDLPEFDWEFKCYSCSGGEMDNLLSERSIITREQSRVPGRTGMSMFNR